MNGTILHRAYAITETKGHDGYLIVVRGVEPLGPAMLELDLDGNLIRNIRLGQFSESPPPVIQKTDNGYTVLLINAWCPEHASYCDQVYGAVYLDNNGRMLDSVNMTGATSRSMIPMNDGSIISYSFISPGTIVKKTRMTPNGSIEREESFKCPDDAVCRIPFGNALIHTSEGGFAMMNRIEKQHGC